MPKILIEGFENFSEVAITKAINLNTPLDLNDSKAITDKLFANGVLEIPIEKSFNVIGLLSALNLANAKVKFVE